MSDPGNAAYKAVCPHVFRVETRWWKRRQVGTGFSIGRLVPSARLVLATAGHVIDFPPNEPVKWHVQQFDDNGVMERQISFTTQETAENELWYSRHNEIDIGFIAIPPEDENSVQFIRAWDRSLPVIDVNQRIDAGGRVGWAGFPGQVEDFLEHPRLCYFEGVVSAFSKRGGVPTYVVDGHCAPGVSGGPVWHWPGDGENIEIVGVVSAYGSSDAMIPGFCVFVAINPLIAYLQTTYSPENVLPVGPPDSAGPEAASGEVEKP